MCVSNKNGKIKSKRVNRIAANDLARLFTESSEILNSANFNLVSTRDESVEMGRGDERKNSDIIFEGLIFFERARREAAMIRESARSRRINSCEQRIVEFIAASIILFLLEIPRRE